MTVFFEHPTMRVVARMLFPSTSEETICDLFSVLNLFISGVLCLKRFKKSIYYFYSK